MKYKRKQQSYDNSNTHTHTQKLDRSILVAQSPSECSGGPSSRVTEFSSKLSR